MENFKQVITTLADNFVSDIFDLVRHASVEDFALLPSIAHASATRAAGATRAAPASVGETASPAPRSRKRLARRSRKQMENAVARIVTAVAAAGRQGLRSEEIQRVLGLDKREAPRPIAMALSQRLLVSKGQKRATTYFAVPAAAKNHASKTKTAAPKNTAAKKSAAKKSAKKAGR